MKRDFQQKYSIGLQVRVELLFSFWVDIVFKKTALVFTIAFIIQIVMCKLVGSKLTPSLLGAGYLFFERHYRN